MSRFKVQRPNAWIGSFSTFDIHRNSGSLIRTFGRPFPMQAWGRNQSLLKAGTGGVVSGGGSPQPEMDPSRQPPPCLRTLLEVGANPEAERRGGIILHIHHVRFFLHPSDHSEFSKACTSRCPPGPASSLQSRSRKPRWWTRSRGRPWTRSAPSPLPPCRRSRQ